jgi:hypothetical protein
MSATSVRPRLTRVAILAVTGATALAVAACGTSSNPNTGKPTASASPTSTAPPSAPAPLSPPAPAAGKDHIEGLIRSVSGNTIHLTQRNRTAATVDFTPSTRVTELMPAQLTDVTAGSCVDVGPAPESAPADGAITAQSVTISPAVDGKCPPLEQPQAGSAGTPPSAPPSAAPAGVHGMVASVSGNTIAVTGTDATGKTTHTNVTVTNTTTYSKHAPSNTQALQQGKCMAAQGTADSGGVLQAMTIDLEPCPPLGGHHHHHHFRL